jgi:hypothetical protein
MSLRRIASAALAVAALHPLGVVGCVAVGASYVYDSHRARRSHQSDEAMQWLNLRGSGIAPGPHTTIMHTGEVRMRGQHKPKTNPPLDPTAKIQLGDDLHPRYDRAAEQDGLRAVGAVFSEVSPSYIPKTFEAADAALRTRLLAVNPAYDRAKATIHWGKLIAKLYDSKSVLHRFYQLDVRHDWDSKHAFEQWVSRFPAGRQTNLRRALASLTDAPLAPRDLRLEGLVKREKTGTLTHDGLSSQDPRVVLSCTDRAIVATGPWHLAHAAAIKVAFPVNPDNYLIWVTSTTVEMMGYVFDAWTQHFSLPGAPCHYLSGDEARFDMHHTDQSADFENATFTAIEAPPEVLMEQAATPFGSMQSMPIRFKLKSRRRASGKNATSKGNFTTNSAAVVHAFGEPGPATYGAFICGDDFLLVGYGSAIALPTDLIHARFAELGFEVTFACSTSTAEVEFISMIPYPTADGTVFGPKIGRVLHRFGWTTAIGPSDIFGAATGLTNNVSFIPFLNEFIALHRRLALDTGTAPYIHAVAETSHLPTPATYEFIEARYGLTRVDELDFRALLATVTSLPASISWPRLRQVVDVD